MEANTERSQKAKQDSSKIYRVLTEEEILLAQQEQRRWAEYANEQRIKRGEKPVKLV